MSKQRIWLVEGFEAGEWYACGWEVHRSKADAMREIKHFRENGSARDRMRAVRYERVRTKPPAS